MEVADFIGKNFLSKSQSSAFLISEHPCENKKDRGSHEKRKTIGKENVYCRDIDHQ
jgi:hypothetical protein